MQVRTKPWPRVATEDLFDDAERQAMRRVLRRGELSGFAATLAGNGGGPEVRALEEETAAAFGVKYAVAVNSGTSALMAAVGALLLSPGAGVFVTPYSMSASVACLLPWGLRPAFRDIDKRDYMVHPPDDPERVSVMVDLFGNLPGTLPEARYIIEDAAQAAGATRDGRYAGTLGDIGCLSMNKYKAGGVGEGGMVLTNDEELAANVGLVRNHAEVIVQEARVKGHTVPPALERLYGFNFRLPEISAALAREQLKKRPAIVERVQQQAAYLAGQLAGAEGLQLPYVAPRVKPAWYRYPVLARDTHERDRLVMDLQMNGVPVKAGYVTPIHRQPIYAFEAFRELPTVDDVESRMVLLGCFGQAVEQSDLDDVVKVLTA